MTDAEIDALVATVRTGFVSVDRDAIRVPDSDEAEAALVALASALDRLVAERDAERRARKAVEDVKADEVLRERTNLEAQIESLIAERDAARKMLDGPDRFGKAVAEMKAAEAERDRLREALERIAEATWYDDRSALARARAIAREALGDG